MPNLEPNKIIEEDIRLKLNSIKSSTALIEKHVKRPGLGTCVKFFSKISEWKHLFNSFGEKTHPILKKAGDRNIITDQTDLIKTSVELLEKELSLHNKIVYEAVQGLWEAKRKNKKVVLLLAPFYNQESLKDGYFKRIKAIDDILGEDILKVYVAPLSLDSDFDEVSKVSIDDSHIKLTLNIEDPEKTGFLKLIGQVSDLIYYHSVAFVNATTLNMDKMQILDLHGAVPEELILQGNPTQAAIESEKERVAISKVEYVICVTNAMAAYLTEKYPQSKAKHIILPIMDDYIYDTKKVINEKKYSEGKPNIMYAGGLQQWQMIPKMQEVIEKTLSQFNYTIVVPDTPAFLDYWKEKSVPSIEVISGQRETVKKVCLKAHYGFLLREDILVNRVSCPTKLIEYLTYGVVPVLLSEAIGDFSFFGMKYIKLKDFASGNIPTEERRLEMVKENYACLAGIMDQYTKGKSELRAIINNFPESYSPPVLG
ncbi:MAG: hypothetical protein VB108_09195 [Anaerolineaceae bacterium]|nr:hypothetical protein [Anaerolineaceae bacterium]